MVVWHHGRTADRKFSDRRVLRLCALAAPEALLLRKPLVRADVTGWDGKGFATSVLFLYLDRLMRRSHAAALQPASVGPIA